ncbi:MAG: DUF1592 domain-containing protein [Planctomycetes bacterium]|nr:DUF1592 domain-containing protein [Planctomycetota bacterium]
MRRRALLACATSAPFAFAGEPPPADVEFARDVLPLLRDSCLDCHAGAEPAASLALDRCLDEAGARATAGIWRRVRDKLERGEMPPPDAPAADEALLAAAQRWLDVRLGTGPGSWPLDPGRVTLRRLSRFEYAFSVRDLLELPLPLAEKLPPDEVGYGFDTIGDVLSLSPLLLEKYAALAEEIAAAALPGATLRTARTQSFTGANQLQTTLDRSYGGDEFVSLYSNGSAFADIELPRAGEYVVRARLQGDQAGPEPCRFALTARAEGADGRRATELLRGEVAEERPAEVEREWRGQLPGGRLRLAVAFLNDYYQADAADPGERDRNLLVRSLAIEGPLDPFPATASERRFFPCGGDHAHTRACARAALERTAARAWRRPVSALELERLLAQVDGALAAGDSLDEALRLALATLLVSPNFLFRSELDAAPEDPTAVRPLTGHELASRLSYFLWSSLPDERLSTLAEQGLLREREILAEEARRLLKDARAESLVTQFAAQWLQLRSLATVAPDPQAFPTFDDALRESMRLETELFVDAVFREGRPLSELLDGDFTFVDERLARHYGIAGVTGPAMRRVRVTDRARRGLLGHASLLTLTSNPTRTSPVKRGKFVLERLLGAPPPPPPPGVGALEDSPEASAAATLRERLAAHRSKPDCAGCHVKMDALGFALERFDPVGAWRDRDGPHPVDDRGTLPDGRALAGAADLAEVVLEGDAFTRCFAEQLLTFALGRGLLDDDRRAVHALVARYRGKSPTFEQLVVDLIGLDGFVRRRGEAQGR